MVGSNATTHANVTPHPSASHPAARLGRRRGLFAVTAALALVAAALVAGSPANAGSGASQAPVTVTTGGSPPTAPTQDPVADFTFECNPILELRYCFFDGRPSAGDITDWDWEFGDGSTGSGETTAKIYRFAGTRDVTLTVTDSDGATDSVTKPVKVP